MNKKNDIQIFFDENPEFKKIFFFLFYALFFAIVILLLRSSASVNRGKVTRYNSGYGHSFTLKRLEDDNYHFHYKIEKNDKTYVFDGDRKDGESRFVVSGDVPLQYYSHNDTYYLRDNTLTFQETTSPMEFSSVISVVCLKDIFRHGTYVSRTEYLSGEEFDYTYEISTSLLVEYIDNISIDVDDIPNRVICHVNKNGVIEEIEMDMTPYFKYYDASIYRYYIVIDYSKFGKIDASDVKRES